MSSGSIDKYITKMPGNSTRSSSKSEGFQKPLQHRDSIDKSDTLNLIRSDLHDLKTRLDKTVKTDELTNIVTSIVERLLAVNNKERDLLIEKKVEERCAALEKRHAEKVAHLEEVIDGLNLDINNLREHISDCKKEMRGMNAKMQQNSRNVKQALTKSNYNEQYSRKTNIKIYGVSEKKDENTYEVTREVLQKNAGVSIIPQNVVAVHRIPNAKRTQPRPILLKLRNSECKAEIMRKRSQVKKSGNGVRLVDDVTAANAKLIKQLTENENVESAWYFNGSVYGKCGEQRVKFDILDDINVKIRRKSKTLSGYESESSNGE